MLWFWVKVINKICIYFQMDTTPVMWRESELGHGQSNPCDFYWNTGCKQTFIWNWEWCRLEPLILLKIVREVYKQADFISPIKTINPGIDLLMAGIAKMSINEIRMYNVYQVKLRYYTNSYKSVCIDLIIF